MIDIKYVVCDDHTLGYCGTDGMIGVIHSSILKGATFELHPCPKLHAEFSSIRRATHQDFIGFMVKIPPDFEGDLLTCKQ